MIPDTEIVNVNNLTVMVRFVYPPIPDRSHDYYAVLKDSEEDLIGWGATKEQAIADLLEQIE